MEVNKKDDEKERLKADLIALFLSGLIILLLDNFINGS